MKSFLKEYRNILFVILIFVAQKYMIHQDGADFSELMQNQRDGVEQRLLDEGLPSQQTIVFSSLTSAIERNIRIYVQRVSSSLTSTNFFILIFMIIEMRKGRDGRGEA